MTYRDTASFGKRQEYATIAELLTRGFDIYQTLVDDQQIDCIIRNEIDGTPIYIDVQIKARSSKAKKQSWGLWPSVKLISPRPNLFFIFYSEPLDRYWVIPSGALADRSYQAPSGKNEHLYNVNLARWKKIRGSGKDQFINSKEFEEFIGAFDLLRNFKSPK